MTAATSASDRYEAAQKALNLMRARQAHMVPGDCRECDDLDIYIAALSALITPPATDETPAEIADRVYEQRRARGDGPVGMAEALVHAGIQAAWETWEPDAYAEPEILSRSFIESVTETTLTTEQYARVLDAVPHSSIPDALSVIVGQIVPDTEEEGE